MMEKFENIMENKEKATGKCKEVEDEKKVKRFDMFMDVQNKKLKLEEKKIEIKATASHDTNILFLKT